MVKCEFHKMNNEEIISVDISGIFSIVYVTGKAV